MRNTKFQKNRKKIQKTKQDIYGFISCRNRLEKAEKEKKYKLSFHSFPTQRVIENSKKIVKMFKKLKKYLYGFLSIQNRSEKAEKERK